MKYGYINQTTETLSLDAQKQALIEAGVHRDNIRDDLDNIVNVMKTDDIIVVCSLDVFQLSTQKLQSFYNNLFGRKLFLISIEEDINTSRYKEDQWRKEFDEERYFHKHLNAIANSESRHKQSMIKPGMKKAKASGRTPGPQSMFDTALEKRIDELLANGLSVTAICDEINVSRVAYYEWRKKQRRE